MRYQVRPMEMADVPQAIEIEREAFPTQWPPTAYKRELQNKLAHYLVAVEGSEPGTGKGSPPLHNMSPEQPESSPGLLARIKRWLGWEPPTPNQGLLSPVSNIVGVVGFWLMLDEAHITTIGVRFALRRRGVGELLMIRSMELAQHLGAQVVTLEVRVSNTGAQALYEKYGFHRVGRRRAYYSDNGEDALIMTTDPITSASYQARFQHLRAAHAQKWNLEPQLPERQPPSTPGP